MVANITQFETGEENQSPVTADPKRIVAAPAAERLAAEMDVDLAVVEGTGKDGRILKRDVEKVIKARREANKTAAPETEEPGKAPEADLISPVPDSTGVLPEDNKSFGFKLVGNFNGNRYELVGLHTDAFGCVELIFDKA